MTTQILTLPDIDVAEPAAKTEKAKEKEKEKERSFGPGDLGGTIWFIGWLFTIGFAGLVWWKALLAVLLWPYFLGVTFQ